MKSEETLLTTSSDFYAEYEPSLSKQIHLPLALEQQTNFMIAAEVPILMGKACEFMIQELTIRAWYHTETTNRKTLSRSDVQAAVADYDVYDFLIDIIKPTSNSTVDYYQITLPDADSSTRSSDLYCNSYPRGHGSSFAIPLHHAETIITNSGNNSEADAIQATNKFFFDTAVTDDTSCIHNDTSAANMDSFSVPTKKKPRIIPPTGDEEMNAVDLFLIDGAHALKSPFR